MKFTQTITGNKRIKMLLESRKTEIFLVAVILLAAIFVRAYHFGAPPIGVHQDEAMAAVDAKALAEYGTDRYGMRYPVHFTAWKNSQMSVFLSYCMVPFIKILVFSTVTIRLPLLITSCLGLLALYLFTRQLAGKWTAMIALLFGMICPWHYMQSRWSIDCNMFPHMFLFAVCFLLAGLHRIEGKKWNRVFLYVSMVFFGLCCYCYAVSDYSVPVFLLAVASYLLKKKQINWKEFLGCIAVYAVIVLPEYLSMLITVLGKETIDAFNTSDTRGNSPSYGTTFQKMGHELLSRDELAVLDGGKCILQLRGVRPFLSDKYDLTQHPNYKLTSDYDPKNTFDIEKYLNRKEKIHPGDEFIVVDADSLPSA